MPTTCGRCTPTNARRGRKGRNGKRASHAIDFACAPFCTFQCQYRLAGSVLQFDFAVRVRLHGLERSDLVEDLCQAPLQFGCFPCISVGFRFSDDPTTPLLREQRSVLPVNIDGALVILDQLLPAGSAPRGTTRRRRRMWQRIAWHGDGSAPVPRFDSRYNLRACALAIGICAACVRDAAGQLSTLHRGDRFLEDKGRMRCSNILVRCGSLKSRPPPPRRR